MQFHSFTCFLLPWLVAALPTASQPEFLPAPSEKASEFKPSVELINHTITLEARNRAQFGDIHPSNRLYRRGDKHCDPKKRYKRMMGRPADSWPGEGSNGGADWPQGPWQGSQGPESPEGPPGPFGGDGASGGEGPSSDMFGPVSVGGPFDASIPIVIPLGNGNTGSIGADGLGGALGQGGLGGVTNGNQPEGPNAGYPSTSASSSSNNGDDPDMGTGSDQSPYDQDESHQKGDGVHWKRDADPALTATDGSRFGALHFIRSILDGNLQTLSIGNLLDKVDAKTDDDKATMKRDESSAPDWLHKRNEDMAPDWLHKRGKDSSIGWLHKRGKDSSIGWLHKRALFHPLRLEEMAKRMWDHGPLLDRDAKE